MTEKLTYSVPEISELLGVSTTKLYQLIRYNSIPHLKLGKRVVIPKKEFTEWLSKSCLGGNI